MNINEYVPFLINTLNTIVMGVKYANNVALGGVMVNKRDEQTFTGECESPSVHHSFDLYQI